MTTEALVLSATDADGVATITLNRPDSINAWIPPMHAALFDAFDAAAADPEVRVIVLTGAGRGFCPGADMNYLASISTGADDSSGGEAGDRRPITYAQNIPKPVVCAINGACAGMGLALAMSCDIRFVAAEANLTTVFARLGLIVEHGLATTLPRACGMATATELLMSSRRFTGAEAAEMGVVHEAISGGGVLSHAQEYARRLATECSPVSLAAIKWQLTSGAWQPPEAALDQANFLMAQTIEGADFEEGVAAFQARRLPDFAPLGQGTAIEYPGDVAFGASVTT